MITSIGIGEDALLVYNNEYLTDKYIKDMFLLLKNGTHKFPFENKQYFKNGENGVLYHFYNNCVVAYALGVLNI